jgi:hypothetical protein
MPAVTVVFLNSDLLNVLCFLSTFDQFGRLFLPTIKRTTDLKAVSIAHYAAPSLFCCFRGSGAGGKKRAENGTINNLRVRVRVKTRRPSSGEE